MNDRVITETKGIDIYCNLYKLTDNEWQINESEYLHSHPADILRDKIAKITRSLEKIQATVNDDSLISEKNDHTKEYILNIDSLHDSFFLIIKSLTPKNGEDNKDAQQWLKRVKPNSYISFNGSTSQRHELIRKMANKLKHDHTEVRPYVMHNHNNKEVRGFYINSVISRDGLNAPDTEIHKKYGKSYTAFSYNHFILYSIGVIFHHLTKLNDALFKTKKCSEINHDFYTLLQKSANIEHQFFPDEYSRAFLSVKKSENIYLINSLYRYNKKKNEDVDKIYGYSHQLFNNQRTQCARAIIPYLPLLHSYANK